MVILNAIQSILSIVIMISIGFILTRKGWFDDKSSKLISKIVTHVSLPALMIFTISNTFDKDMLVQSVTGLVIPMVSIFACFFISMMISKYVATPGRQGVFQVMFAASNTVFIGLPVNLALQKKVLDIMFILYPKPFRI